MTAPTREGASALQNYSHEYVSDELPGQSGAIRVVLVDDDNIFRASTVAALADFGFELAEFAGGAEMLDYFAMGNTADIVVLDWKLPQISGIELMHRLRRRGILVPIIFLTGIARETYEEAALDSGALDFVDKIRGTAILAKRIRLIVEAGKRPAELPTVEDLCVGRLTLKPKVSHAYWDGEDVGLTVTEFNVVHLLASHAGEEMTYRSLYDCVRCVGFVAGNGEDGYRTNVRSSVKRIRNKFRAIDADFAEIKNFLGFGYCWMAPTATPD